MGREKEHRHITHKQKQRLTHLYSDKLIWLSDSNHSRQKYLKIIRLSSDHQCTIKLILYAHILWNKHINIWITYMITINLKFHWYASCFVVTAAFRNWNFKAYMLWPNLQGLEMYKQPWVSSNTELPCYAKMLCSFIWSIMSGKCVV